MYIEEQVIEVDPSYLSIIKKEQKQYKNELITGRLGNLVYLYCDSNMVTGFEGAMYIPDGMGKSLGKIRLRVKGPANAIIGFPKDGDDYLCIYFNSFSELTYTKCKLQNGSIAGIWYDNQWARPGDNSIPYSNIVTVTRPEYLHNYSLEVSLPAQLNLSSDQIELEESLFEGKDQAKLGQVYKLVPVEQFYTNIYRVAEYGVLGIYHDQLKILVPVRFTGESFNGKCIQLDPDDSRAKKLTGTGECECLTLNQPFSHQLNMKSEYNRQYFLKQTFQIVDGVLQNYDGQQYVHIQSINELIFQNDLQLTSQPIELEERLMENLNYKPDEVLEIDYKQVRIISQHDDTVLHNIQNGEYGNIAFLYPDGNVQGELNGTIAVPDAPSNVYEANDVRVRICFPTTAVKRIAQDGECYRCIYQDYKSLFQEEQCSIKNGFIDQIFKNGKWIEPPFDIHNQVVAVYKQSVSATTPLQLTSNSIELEENLFQKELESKK